MSDPRPRTSGAIAIPHGGYRQIQAAAVILDIFIIGFSTMAAYVIRFGFVGMVQEKYLYQLMLLVPALIVARVGINTLLGVYRVVWRYVGLPETLRFVRAVAMGSIIVSAALLVVRYASATHHDYLQIPIGIIVLEGLFTFTGITVSRFVPRIVAEAGSARGGDGARPTLLLGAGRGGLAIAREAAVNGALGIRPVGFLDDDPAKAGKEVHGLRVFGPVSDMIRVLRQTGATDVIITTSTIRAPAIMTVMDQARPLGVQVRIVSNLFELLDFKVGADTLREVRIEDLLSRDPVPPSLSIDDLTGAYGGKRILVTGAGGSIGSELCRQLVRMRPAALLMVERDETNLFEIERELIQDEPAGDRAPGRQRARDAGGASAAGVCIPILGDIGESREMAEIFKEHRPQVVFHAAAYKHVPMMERFPYKAVHNNVFGTRQLAEMAAQHGVESFVMISTDKAVRPSSVMGATKRLAEMVVQSIASRSETKFSCVRFGNVLGSRGSVVSIFRRQIQQGGPVTVTHPEARRYFMTIAEAANLVIQAGTLGESGEVFLLDMGEPVRIIELARQMIRLSGASEDSVPIEIVGTRPGEKLFEELRTDAERIEKTALRKIFRCSLGDIDSARLEATIERMNFLVRVKDAEGVRTCLRELDIGYQQAHASPAGNSQPA